MRDSKLLVINYGVSKLIKYLTIRLANKYF